MLNIITSLSLDALAKDMLEKVKSKDVWKDPFVSPIIVFTDAKTEQWFKLHVLQNSGVLMNLNTVRLENFLFDMLKSDEKQSLLSPGLLRDIIIQKLLPDEKGNCYLDKIKDYDNIGNYLNVTENTANIDYKHLFDFADDLSKLFIEYEATRKDIDDVIPGDDWQKDLYKDIVNKGIEFDDRQYYTCPELAVKNKKDNGGKIVFKDIGQPVFVFGFSGMGQTYRQLLQEYGKQSNIYIYLQTSGNAKDENNTNIFLKHWGQFGRTNYNLFGKDAVFSEKQAFTKINTTLAKIQNSIAKDVNIENLEELKVATNDKDEKVYDDTLTITCAPSKIKELEIVHSAICKLLKDKEKNVTLKDILVLAPDIYQYKSAISSVFDQVDENDEEYPFIPTSVVDFSGQNSGVFDILKSLYTILHNGGLTRKTFFSFTKNYIIQNRYDISDNDVSLGFKPWIESMQVYRIRTQNNATQEPTDEYQDFDDWEKAVKRLLVAKLTDKTTCFSAGNIEPVSDFIMSDDNLVTKFVRIIDDIKNFWLKEFQNRPTLDEQGLIALQTFFKDLFGLDEYNKYSLFKETFIYKKINQKLDMYLEQYHKFNIKIPTECVLLSLMDIASNTKFDTGAVFTRGVTFTSLLPNRILGAKYVFLIGMSSDNFPGTNSKIALDRRLHLPQYGDDDIPGKNKNAFLCQLMATGNELHISFVDKDLQTDNVFYPSCVLDVLKQYTGIPTQKIGIDEERDWQELYTPRERRNKQVCIDLTKTRHKKTAEKETKATSAKHLPENVNLKDLRYFLENPLKYYAQSVFGFEEDDTSNKELEDIELNALGQDKLTKRLIKPMLGHLQQLGQEKIQSDDVPENLQWTHYKDLLPNEPFAEIEFNKVKQKLKNCLDYFTSYNAEKFNDSQLNIEPNYQINLPMKATLQDGNTKKYLIYGEILMCAYTDSDVFLYVPKDKDKDAQRRFPELYALVAQIAQQNQQPDKEYLVHVLYVSPDGVKSASEKMVHESTGLLKPETMKISGKIAEEKLNEFYSRMFETKDKRYIPYFSDGIKEVTSFEQLRDDYFLNKEKRQFISHQELFDPDEHLGFSKENFYQEFKAALSDQGSLLKFDNTEE